MTFVGVCGGRDYLDAKRVDKELSGRVNVATDAIVHGGARGADFLAASWAARNGVHAVEIAALWGVFKNGAGPRRNAVIASLPLRLLVAFPGGKGTADMIKKARAAGIPVDIVTGGGR